MTSRTAFVLALAVALGGVPVRLSAQESQPHPLFELGLSGAFIGGAFDVSDIHQDVQTDTGGLSPSVGISLSERFSIEGAVVIDRVETEPVVTHKKLTGPNFFLITTGIRYLAGRHVAVRAEGGGVIGSPGFGIQGSAGIVIPIGSFVLP